MTEYDLQEIQEMIDASIEKAMAKHNRNATLISALLGSVLLGFYAHGVLALVGR